MALLDQVGEVVDAAREAVPLRAVLPGGALMLLVEVVLMVVGGGGRGGGWAGGVVMVVVLVVLLVVVVVNQTRARAGARAGTRAEARQQSVDWARVGTGSGPLSAVACALEVERGVDGGGSGRVPEQLRGGEGVSYGKG